MNINRQKIARSMLTLKDGNQFDEVDEAFEAVAEDEDCNNHQEHRCDHLALNSVNLI